MRKVCIYMVFAIYTMSCQTSNSKNDFPTIRVVPEEKVTLLEDVAKDVKLLSLKIPDSILFGEVTHIKTNKEKIFLWDENQTKTITVFDDSGKYISQLNKKGNGPGEYSKIDAFAISPDGGRLVVYQRPTSFSIYSFPEFDFISSVPYNKDLMNFEILTDNKYLIVSDENVNREKYEGLKFLDVSSLESAPIEGISNDAASIEMSYPNTMTHQKEFVLYASPSEYTDIYGLNSKKTDLIARIDFGEYRVPEEYWKLADATEFEMKFVGKPRATWVQNVIYSNQKMSFYYMFKAPILRNVVVYDFGTNSIQDYGVLRFSKTGKAVPYPIGVYGEYYVSIIFAEDIELILPENVDKDSLKHDWQRKIYESKDENAVFLLLYKLL